MDRLEITGVIEKVEDGDPVLKLDGSVRICRDYKVIIVPELDVQQYPLVMAADCCTKPRGE